MTEKRDRVGIRLDVIDNVIRYLNEDVSLQDIFGRPVCKSLVIVADGLFSVLYYYLGI